MKLFQQFIQSHRKKAWIGACGLILFFNCCGFPVYNFNKDWSLAVGLEYLWLFAISAALTGGLLAGLFPEKRFWFVFLWSGFWACGGLVCRFLIEFGEVSNSYNFTPANIALHLVSFASISAFTWWQAVQKGREEV